MATYTAILEQDEESGWWIAQCAEVPGALTQGKTRAEAKRNLKDAIVQVLAAQAELTKAKSKRRTIVERVSVPV
ncbi:MAG: type II toxin-antitoxin system HicB family antitoxin [Planctomycetota bacterium]